MKNIARLVAAGLLSCTAVASDVNWAEFLSRHDTVWGQSRLL